MPIRNISLTERQEALKLKGLREAAAAGFATIDRGEFEEVPADAIGATVRAIGRRAGDRVRTYPRLQMQGPRLRPAGKRMRNLGRLEHIPPPTMPYCHWTIARQTETRKRHR